jgi:putative membrane protein
MLQHLLISFVAAPLLVLGSPGTLLLRVASARVRHGLVLPLLHSRLVRTVTFPVLTWLLFAVVMWAAHFSPLFELALESDPIHQVEHLAFLVSGFLYWLPAIGSDPLPWRLGGSSRLLYLFLGMPQSSVLGLVIVSQTTVMYHHYVAVGALADQRLAGTLMWIGADLISFALIGVAGWLWLTTETRRAARRRPADPFSVSRPE